MGVENICQYMLGKQLKKGDTDKVLAGLSHPIRRRLLFKLYEEDQGGGDVECRLTDVLEFQQNNVRIALYHNHLPKLESDGFVQWHKENQTVTKGPDWGKIEPLLRLIYNHLNELPPLLRGTESAV